MLIMLSQLGMVFIFPPPPFPFFHFLFSFFFNDFVNIIDPKSSDKAIGSFALFNSIVFGFWTTVLWIYRDDLISNRQNSATPQLDVQPLNTRASSSPIPPLPSTSSSIPTSTSSQIKKNNINSYTSTSKNNLDHVPLHHDDDDDGVVDVDLEDSQTF